MNAVDQLKVLSRFGISKDCVNQVMISLDNLVATRPTPPILKENNTLVLLEKHLRLYSRMDGVRIPPKLSQFVKDSLANQTQPIATQTTSSPIPSFTEPTPMETTTTSGENDAVPLGDVETILISTFVKQTDHENCRAILREMMKQAANPHSPLHTNLVNAMTRVVRREGAAMVKGMMSNPFLSTPLFLFITTLDTKTNSSQQPSPVAALVQDVLKVVATLQTIDYDNTLLRLLHEYCNKKGLSVVKPNESAITSGKTWAANTLRNLRSQPPLQPQQVGALVKDVLERHPSSLQLSLELALSPYLHHSPNHPHVQSVIDTLVTTVESAKEEDVMTKSYVGLILAWITLLDPSISNQRVLQVVFSKNKRKKWGQEGYIALWLLHHATWTHLSRSCKWLLQKSRVTT